MKWKRRYVKRTVNICKKKKKRSCIVLFEGGVFTIIHLYNAITLPFLCLSSTKPEHICSDTVSSTKIKNIYHSILSKFHIL